MIVDFIAPSDLIVRPVYIRRVIPYIGKKLIKVFTGQRRVGKSYLLFQIINYIKKQDTNAAFIYINKEDFAFTDIRTAADLNAYVTLNKNKNHKTYVFIDEIQEIEAFENALRSLILDESLDIYCTGSNSDLLSKDIAGKLSGRCIEISVYSLSFPEFLDFQQLDNSGQSLELFLKFGGLPYLKHLPLIDHIVFDYLKNIYNTILYRDIVNRYAVRNTRFLEQLVLFLAGNIGSLFSAKKISDYLKSSHISISPNQVQTFISHLVHSFIVHQVSRYDIPGKRIFDNGEKYYFENLGIRHGLWGYRPDDLGKIMENAVYNHLVFQGFHVTIGIIDKTEIDFIAERDGEKQYFQIALSITEPKTFEREFGNLKKITDNYPKTVITYDAFNGNTSEGIKHTDLRSFLSVIP